MTLANRVREVTLTTGTGDITLVGAVAAHVTFADAFSVGDTVTYVIEDGDNYEIGNGTLVATDTLERTSVGETLVDGVYDKISPGAIDLSGNALVFCAATADFLLDPNIKADVISEVAPGAGVTVDAGMSIGSSLNDKQFEVHGAGARRFYVNDDGVVAWNPSAAGGELSWDTNKAIIKANGNADNLVLRGSGAVENLTLDALGNIETAGNIAVAGSILSNNSTGGIVLGSDTSVGAGANIVLYPSAHATQASDIALRAGSTNKLFYNHSGGSWSFTTLAVEGITSLSMSGRLNITGSSDLDFDSTGRVLLFNAGAETWHNSYRAVQYCSLHSDMFNATGVDRWSNVNAYFSTGSTWKRQSTGTATTLSQTTTGIAYKYATSGAVDTDIAFVDKWAIDGATGNMTVTGLIKTSGAGMIRNSSNAQIQLAGGDATNDGGNVIFSGSAYAGTAGDINFREGSDTKLLWDASLSIWNYNSNAISGVPSIVRGNNAVQLILAGGTDGDSGGNLVLYGENHATTANDILFRSGTTQRLRWDDSGSVWTMAGRLVVSSISELNSVFQSSSTTQMTLSGGTSPTVGANIRIHGQSHTTYADQTFIRYDEVNLAEFGVGLTTLKTRLDIDVTSGVWFKMKSGADTGAVGTFLKANGTPFGYIGGGAGAAISGKTADDLALRSEGTLYLAANGNNVVGAFTSSLATLETDATVNGDLTVSGDLHVAETKNIFFGGSTGDYVAAGIEEGDPDLFKIGYYQNSSLAAAIEFTSNSESAGDGLFNLKIGSTTAIGVDNSGNVEFSGTTTVPAIHGDSNSSALDIYSGTDTTGANIILYGSTHSIQANDILIRTGSTDRLHWDHSADYWDFNNTSAIRISDLQVSAASNAAKITIRRNNAGSAGSGLGNVEFANNADSVMARINVLNGSSTSDADMQFWVRNVSEGLALAAEIKEDKSLNLEGKLSLGGVETLTISSGAVTVSKSFHRIAVESGSTDDLTTINGGNNGDILVLRAATDSNTVVVKDSATIALNGDFTMDLSTDMLVLIHDSGLWVELSRSNNG